MAFLQKELTLKARSRGFHLITREVMGGLQELSAVKVGILHLFVQHTSCSLCLNENADPTVRIDMEAHFNEMVPEDAPYYRHNYEGSDDMPAHLKSAILGSSLTIPIHQGRLRLGTWQGIYLCEHRNHGGHRKLIATIQSD